MSNATLDLLSLTPQAAMELFLAQSVKDDVDVDQLYVFKVTPGPGVQTRLEVGLALQPEDLSSWKYGGTVSFTYNRIDLADFFRGIDLRFTPPQFPLPTSWLCEKIASIGRIEFDPVDFVQETITKEMAVSYHLKAAADSLRWVGEVPINLFKQKSIPSFFVKVDNSVQTELGELAVITQEMGIGLRSFETNGTILVKTLLNLPVGYTFTAPTGAPAVRWELFDRILSAMPGTWILDSSGRKNNNGYGATVLYNGPINPEFDKPYNRNLDHVCRIQLNPSYCANQTGVLSIYYCLARLEN